MNSLEPGQGYSLPTLSQMVVELTNRVDELESSMDAHEEASQECFPTEGKQQEIHVHITEDDMIKMNAFMIEHRNKHKNREDAFEPLRYLISLTSCGIGQTFSFSCHECDASIDIISSDDW